IVEVAEGITAADAAAEGTRSEGSRDGRPAVGQEVRGRSGPADIMIAGDDVKRNAAKERGTALIRRDVAVPVGHPDVAIITVRPGDVDVVTRIERQVGRRKRGLSWQRETRHIEHGVDDPRLVVRDERWVRAWNIRVVPFVALDLKREMPI